MSEIEPDPPSSSFLASLDEPEVPKRDFYDPNIGLVTDEWEIRFDDIKFEKEIGSGSFGRVMRANYLGTDVAIKELFNPDDKLTKKYMQREINTLKNIHHPNIVQFIGLSSWNNRVFLVTEFITGGDVSGMLQDAKKVFPWKAITNILLQTAQAIAYLHSRQIIHRDLKPANLLLSENQKVKVCDFGMARKVSHSKAPNLTLCGTDEYMAPEVIMGDQYNVQADVFSFGMCIFEMITRKIPPQRTPSKAYAFDMVVYKSWAPKSVPPLLQELLFSCVNHDSAKRPVFKEILEFMKKFDRLMETDLTPITDYPSFKVKLPDPPKVAEPPKVVQQPPKVVAPVPAPAPVPIASPVTNNAKQEPPKPNPRTTSSPKFPEPKISPEELQKFVKEFDDKKTLTDSQNENLLKSLDELADDVSEMARRNTISEITYNPNSPQLKPKPYDPKAKLLSNTVNPNVFSLHEICGSGDVIALKKLLDEKSKEEAAQLIEAKNSIGETALFLAVKYSRFEVAQLLLQYSSKSANIPNNTGMFPLHLSCKNSNVQISGLLLQYDAKLKVGDLKGKNYPLHYACESGNIDLVLLLLKHGGFSILETCNDLGESPILTCAKNLHYPLVSNLAKAGAKLDVVDSKKQTLVWYLAQSDNVDIMAQMLELGAPVDVPAADFTTALYHAAKKGNLEMALLLLKSGADLNRYRKHSLGNSAEFRQKLFAANPSPAKKT